MWKTIVILSVAAAAEVPLGAPESAEMCGRCHRSIHTAWKQSVHSRATENHLFQDAMERAAAAFGRQATKACMECHAPVAVLTGDSEMLNKVSWEGVTCDYCHSVQSVSVMGENPTATVSFSLVKSGPSKDARSTAHGTVFSAVHASSLACVACHEYRNPLGFPVLTTYSEWKNSPAARQGQQCQACHMYQVEGNVVEPRVKRTRTAKVNLHEMPGSHTLEQLNKTVRATLSTSREGNMLKASVHVTNRMAGHYVPTGSPLRRIVLQVRADSYNGQSFQQEREYRRVVADQNGEPLEGEHVAMLRAAKELSDTRLAPDEKRLEEFHFPVPSGVQTRVKATFTYFYSPASTTGSQKRVTFLTLSRLVR